MTKSLFSSGIVVAFYTLLSRILGLFRELFIASMFGSSHTADAVNVAFKLPNLFRRIFAEGALASVFVPIFNHRMVESHESAQNFASKVFYGLLCALIILVFTMQLFMPYLMIIIAPGFNLDSDKFDTTVLLCRITMPYIIFISLSALLGSMLNSVGRFVAFAFAPVILNLAIIFGGLGLSKLISSEKAISYSIIFGGMLQLIFMWICAKRNSINITLPKITNNTDSKDIRTLLVRMIPATISSGAAQLNLFISQSIASFIDGAVSILSYAERIYQFPLSIIGIAFGTILLPTLSKLYKLGDKQQIFSMQNNAIKLALFLSIPCAIGIIILSHHITYIIYQHGAFTSSDTTKTAEAMAAFAIGLPAFILAKIFMPIFYANHDTKTPMKVTIYALTLNTLLNIILMIPFGQNGIALGSSIAAWYNLWLLIRYAKSHGYLSANHDIFIYLIKVYVCSIIMAALVLISNQYLHSYHYSDSLITRILSITLTIFLGITTYVVSAFLCKVFNKEHIKSLIKL